MSRSWTTQQQQAIEDRGGALLLSAAAGSGKTAVLTQRAVELIADEAHPLEADRLLIVTFTNAAAAELRQRMAAALDEKLARDPGSTWLRRQKLLLGRASVCTVDSFCIDLLTQHFTETDLPGDFTVIKAAEETALRQEALEQTLEEAYENAAFRQFASQYGRARSDAAAADAVLRLYDITRAMAEPERWWQGLAADYTVRTTPADTRWGAELLDAAAVQLDGVCLRLQYALSLAADAEDFAKAKEILTDELAQAQRIRDAVSARDWQLCCDRSRTASFLRWPRMGKNADAARKGRMKELRDNCKKAVLELQEKIFVTDTAEFLAEQELCLPMVQALAAAAQRFAQLLFEKKLELKAFGFDDFEHAALRLLQNEDGSRTPLAQELSLHYALVMVDEYQDTNDLQDRLYRMLAKPDGSNLFFVGDVKQSIYGFRDARPECFIEKKDAYAPYDGVHYPATILLSRNFRSTAATLHAINDIFAPLFRRAVGGVDYAAGEELIPGLGATALEVPVHMVLTDASPQEDAEAAVAANDVDTVAQLIARMLAEGAPVRDGAATRPCRPGDFCILLRSPGGKGRLYTEKLESMGIGAFCRAEDELLSDPQVQLLLSFLRILDNPGQDIHLAALLLSPLYGFSPDDLTTVRLACRKGTLYAALLQMAGEDAGAAPDANGGITVPSDTEAAPQAGVSAPEADSRSSARTASGKAAPTLSAAQSPAPSAAQASLIGRIRAFLASLRALRRRALGMPVHGICALLLDETGLYHMAGALPGGESCQQNLRTLQSVAGEYEGIGGLPGFLRLVDSAIRNGRPLADRRGSGSPADRVQLMSIHASKGLEFPIVILADASHGFNTSDLTGNVLLHSELGVAFKLQEAGTRTLMPTLAVRALANRMQSQMAGEEMRLLYVALTRARDRLILSWCDKRPSASLADRALTLAACDGRPDVFALRQTGLFGMGHWLMLALLGHPDAAVLRRSADWPDLPRRMDTAGHFTFSIVPAAPAVVQTTAAPVRTAAPDAALTAALRANFLTQPAAAPPLPVKVSVSALSHKNAAPVLGKPAFLHKEGLTAAQRGTALHKFLQLADLAAARRDVGGELTRLVTDGYLSADTAASIDRAVLERFLHSPLVERMLAAPTLLREYEFISRIPAGLLADGTPTAQNSDTVFLLGIADCVLVYDGIAELVDYKTDHGKTPAQFLQTYAAQLALYRDAIEKRLNVRVTRSVIYSFDLGQEIEVP